LRGRYGQAVGQFRLYEQKGRLLSNYALYFQALSLFKLKEYRKSDYVFNELAVSNSNEKFAFYKNAVFYLALAEEKNDLYPQEISHLKYIIARDDKDSVRSYAMFKIYKAYLKLKNSNQADYYLLRLYIDYPYFCRIHKIFLNKKAKLNYSQRIRRGLDLYYDSYYRESLSLLKKILGKSKRARFITLKDLIKLGDPSALRKIDECIKGGKGINSYKYYGVKKIKLLDLKAFYYYYILHKTQKTEDILNFIASKYGFLDKKNVGIYRAIVWSGVLRDLKEGSLISAAKNLKSFLSINAKVNADNAKFLFWYGVILEKLGYKSRASFYFNIIKGSRILRYSYYGIMSGIMINKSNGMKGIYAKTENLGYINDSAGFSDKSYYRYLPSFEKALKTYPLLNLTLKRLKAFLNLKLYYLANIETARFASGIRNKKFGAFFAYALYRNKKYGAAINLTSDLIYKKGYRSLLLDGNILKVLYPRPYYGYVEKYSSHYDIPVNLIYGVMRQESRYNPVCYSSASAIGLMQIIPSTGYYIARNTGCYNFNPSMLFRKNINISFGSYYLKTLLNQFRGRKYLAIASYNAGPGAVLYWRNRLLKNYGMPLFVELIPFGQTRNYVKKVLANYYVYNSLYK
jgi:soluble lytic murein transglycosylase